MSYHSGYPNFCLDTITLLGYLLDGVVRWHLQKYPKKLLPVRTGLVAKSITSPEMFRYSTAASCTCALLAVHAHC